jgi:hypothetical protein
LRNSFLGVGLTVGVLALGAASAQARPKHHKHVRHHYSHVRHIRHLHVLHSHRAAHHALVVHEHAEVTGAENELVGIHLYDSMLHVLEVYGSPDQIEPLSLGGNSQGGQGFGGGAGGFGGMGRGRGQGGAPGFPGAPGRPGGAGGPMLGPGPGAGGATPGPGADLDDPFSFGDTALKGIPPGVPGGGGGGAAGPRLPGGGGGRPGGFPGGPGGFPGGPGGFPGAGGFPGGPGGGFPGRPGGGTAPTGSGGAAEAATYTRWVYNRNDNKYGFVIDKNGHVIEIEAIGITNPKVKTHRGVTFGTDFGTIIRKYHDPDGYDIAGDNITMRYLVHDKVAFKLTRLGEKKPHAVTGIVVAAGKP